MNACAPLDGTLYTLWEAVRSVLIEQGRETKTRVPDWYFDHWYSMTRDSRKKAIGLVLSAIDDAMHAGRNSRLCSD